MITRLNHVSVFVLDQDSAYEFYVNKLGFNVHTDAPMGPGMRWLTVYPPGQPELEISLIPGSHIAFTITIDAVRSNIGRVVSTELCVYTVPNGQIIKGEFLRMIVVHLTSMHIIKYGR